MSRYESDYDDRDRPLAFEPRRGARSPGPAPVTLVMSVLVLAGILGGAGFLLYRDGVRGPNDGPRPLGAPLNDVRTMVPPQPATSDASAGLTVWRDDSTAPAAPPNFAPPPEAPVASRATSVASPATPPAAVAAPPEAAPAKSSNDAHSEAPPKTAAVGKTGEDAIAALALSAERAAAQTAAVSPTVQIGAFSSRAEANAGWDAAARAAPGAMAGRDRQVARIGKDGLWRAAITGFASRDEARALCDRLRAAGQTCFVR